MKTRSACATLVALAICQGVSAQEAMLKDRFLQISAAGSLALIREPVEALADTKTLVPLARNSTTGFRHRGKCVVAIAHRDEDQNNADTFVGVQIIKVYKQHDSPGVVHVHRNPGWFSREGKPIGEEFGEVSAAGTAGFAEAHKSSDALAGLKFADGKRLVAALWHARPTPADRDYTADAEHSRFWGLDPLSAKALREAHPALFANGNPPVRTENRLIRFTLTNGWNPLRMPTFNFRCDDQLLQLVALRSYLPFASDTAWTYVRFD